MAGRMEDLLMGSDSDSDADEGKVGDADVKVNVAVPAPAVPAPAGPNANNAGQQPSSSGTNNNASKSELTNRLKNLYSSSSSSPPKAIPPTMNVARTGGPSSSHNPNYVPPMVHNQHHHNAPATAPQQQHMQPQQQTQQQHHQQQPPPPLVGVGRVPAPLPKSRTNSRTAPPNNRMAAVPNIPPSPMTASSVPARQPFHPRQQQQQTQQTQQATASTSSQGVHRQQQQPNPLMQTSDHSAKSSNSSRSSGQTSSALADKEKKEKERFLMFTRVLMKYLEQRDSEMHAKAKQEIKECYEKNKRGDAAYKSLTQSMKSRLRATVGETYWKKAHDYLDHFFKQKQQQHQGHSQHQSSHSQPLPPHHQQQQQQQPPLNHTGPPPTVRTSGQHPTSQPPQPSQQHMMPQQQKINMQQTTTTSAALTKQQVDAKKKEKAEIAKKKRNEQAKAKRAAAKKAKEAATLPTSGITLASSTSASTAGVTGSTVLSGSASVSSIGSKKVIDSKKAPKKKPASRPSVTKKKKAEASYKFKDNVHHAFLIDAKSIPNILSKDHKMDLKLDEEQRILLYGDQRQREQVKAITDAASDALLAGAVDETLADAGIPPLPWKIPAVYEGWGDKNLLSVRAAWSKVRLPESELQQEEMEQRDAEKLHKTENEADLPTSSEVVISSDPARSSTRLEDDTSNHVWHNETRAEQDPTLALLSEATEMYLKEAIEKAIGKARLRQNLDGVRLWHTLHSHHADPSSSNGKQPPACIRLGCDVRRQVALADGNAAKTYQRLEEAIERENNTFHFDPEDPEKMVLEATSMSDLSRKPPLKSAASDADAEAKRRFEVFAGKDIQEPPFGRVPKKAKVILTDLSVEAVVNQTPAIRARRRRLLGGW